MAREFEYQTHNLVCDVLWYKTIWKPDQKVRFSNGLGTILFLAHLNIGQQFSTGRYSDPHCNVKPVYSRLNWMTRKTNRSPIGSTIPSLWSTQSMSTDRLTGLGTCRYRRSHVSTAWQIRYYYNKRWNITHFFLLNWLWGAKLKLGPYLSQFSTVLMS